MTATVLCHLFGGQLRDLVSPQAVCVLPEYVLYENQVCIQGANDILHTDAEGQFFLYTVVPTDRYPEDAYEVGSIMVDPVFVDEDHFLIAADAVESEMRFLVRADKPFSIGDRVTIADKGTWQMMNIHIEEMISAYFKTHMMDYVTNHDFYD